MPPSIVTRIRDRRFAGSYAIKNAVTKDINCPGVPAEVLNPKSTWQDKEAYDENAKKLAEMFVKNFGKYTGMDQAIIDAGPTIKLPP